MDDPEVVPDCVDDIVPVCVDEPVVEALSDPDILEVEVETAVVDDVLDVVLFASVPHCLSTFAGRAGHLSTPSRIATAIPPEKCV